MGDAVEIEQGETRGEDRGVWTAKVGTLGGGISTVSKVYVST
jgi:hypothetical protein